MSRVAFDENENETDKGERKRWVLSFLRGGRGGGVTEVDLQPYPPHPQGWPEVEGIWRAADGKAKLNT